MSDAMKLMNRREAVRRIALLMGTAMVASEAILRGDVVAGKMAAPFTDADKALLDSIGDTIIPDTDIPGAKAAGIGPFIAMMVTDCYNAKQHAAFAEGLVAFDKDCRAKYGSGFQECTPAQRLEFCNALNAAQKAMPKTKDATHSFFHMVKDLTVLGYFSSEIGATKAVKYVEVPGAFHGDYPYKKGDRAWF